MKAYLHKLLNYGVLTKTEAKQVLVDISKEKYNPFEVSAFITVFMMREIKQEELEGFRDALLELAIRVDLTDFDPVDLCGTGGDGKNTFNISTISSFIVSGSGIPVAKHGNYGVSSSCGSSNVLEKLGISFSNDASYLKKCIEQSNFCFLHAPLFHPAMRFVAPIRKGLGLKTFFNMLGPMVNPAQPKYQLIGVFSLSLARKYGYIYQNTDKTYTILHDINGYDEISLTGNVRYINNTKEGLFDPHNHQIKRLQQSEIEGPADVDASAKLFLDILQNRGTEAQNLVVLANASMAISTVKKVPFSEAFQMASESLKSGAAFTAFHKLSKIT